MDALTFLAYEGSSWTKLPIRRFVMALHGFRTPILLVDPLFSEFDSSNFSLPSLSLLFCRTEEYSISNKDMSHNQTVISAFKSDAVWIQQLKDPSLPRYLFGLYKAYTKRNTRGAAKK